MEDRIYKQLKAAVHAVLGITHDFDIKWLNAIRKFNVWEENLPVSTSFLVRNLVLIEMICDEFNSSEIIRQNENVANIVLEGTTKVGEVMLIAGEQYTVVEKTIGSSFGVLYRLRSASGREITHEFFD